MQDYGSFEIMFGDSLPTQYDGNVIFEIPPEEVGIREDFLHYDGHAWTHGNRYSISNLLGYVKVLKHMYIGHLRCDNVHCAYLKVWKGPNSALWREEIEKVPIPEESLPKGTLRCWYHQHSPFCVVSCSCRLYASIVVDSLQHKRLYVHTTSHYHPIASNKNLERNVLLENCTRSYLREKLGCSPKVVVSKVAKEYIHKVVMNEEKVRPSTMVQGEVLIESLENLPPMCDDEVVQYVTKKVIVEQSKSNVLEVKIHFFYSFVQRNRCFGQDFRGTLFMFKMSIHGLGSRAELVRCMTEGDLHHAYVMFDHIKLIHN